MQACLTSGTLIPTKKYALAEMSPTNSDKQKPKEPHTDIKIHNQLDTDTQDVSEFVDEDVFSVWMENVERERQPKFTGDSEPQDESEPRPPVDGGGLYRPPDLNRHVTKPLSELQTIYDFALGDKWRSFTYVKEIHVLEKLPYKLTDESEVDKVQGLGPRIKEKVREILTTGRLKKLESLKANPEVRCIHVR